MRSSSTHRMVTTRAARSNGRSLLLRFPATTTTCSSSRILHVPRRQHQSQLRLQLYQHRQQQQHQQRRHYLYFPSDWSELTFRWKLFWKEHNTPTKVKIRLQDRYRTQKGKMQDRYNAQKGKLRDRYQTEKHKLQDRWNSSVRSVPWKARYQREKVAFQSRCTFQKDQFQRRVQDRKLWYQRKRLELQQRQREFTRRWSARRRDIMMDSSSMVKGYMIMRKRKQQQQQQQPPVVNRHHDDDDSDDNIMNFTVTEYSQPHWFHPVDGRPLTSRDPTGRFVNPWMSWSTNGVQSITNILTWRYQRAVRLWKEGGWESWFLPQEGLSRLLWGSPILLHNNNNNSNNKDHQQRRETATPIPTTTSEGEIQLTWIGHSTCLVQMGVHVVAGQPAAAAAAATILTDPIFSHRCTPFPRLPGVGVARAVPPSMALDELPPRIDVCLVSHDHYDHLDQLTIVHLRDRVHYWIVPVGLKDWLETRCSVDPERIKELEWWESVYMIKQQHQQQQESDNSNESTATEPNDNYSWQVVPKLPHDQEDGTTTTSSTTNTDTTRFDTMTITCCPAQHWSSRTFFDRCKRLWCGFAVETQTQQQQRLRQRQQHEPPQLPVVQKFFFAGDTGMPRNGFPLFRQIGDFCGRGMYHHPHQHQHPTKVPLPESDDEKATTSTSTTSAATSSTTKFSRKDATSSVSTISSSDHNQTKNDTNDDGMMNVIVPTATTEDEGESVPEAATTATSTTAGTQFHPFDLAAIPIGAYDPPFLMQDAHMNPREAVECARQLRARKAVAIHWGTFALSEEPMDEPPQKLKQALVTEQHAAAAAAATDFVTLPIGGSIRVVSSSSPPPPPPPAAAVLPGAVVESAKEKGR